MIRFIFLDLDDTLLDFHRTEEEAIRKTLRELLGEEPSEAIVRRYSEINDAQWKRLERGELTIPEVRLSRFEILFSELGRGGAPYAAQSLYDGFLNEGHDLIDGAVAFLEKLSARYPLYLASNGSSQMQRRRISSAGIDRFFKEIFISAELEAVKPQKAFFDACFAKIPQFDPAQSILLGDSLTSDIRGGNGAGMHTCWFNPQHKPNTLDIPVTYEIDNLGEIMNIVK